MLWADARKQILANNGTVHSVYRVVQYDMDGDVLNLESFELKKDAVRFLSEMFKRGVDCDLEMYYVYTQPRFKEN